MVTIRFVGDDRPEENLFETDVTDERFELLQEAAAAQGLSWQELLEERLVAWATAILLMDTAEIQALRAWIRAQETH